MGQRSNEFWLPLEKYEKLGTDDQMANIINQKSWAGWPSAKSYWTFYYNFNTTDIGAPIPNHEWGFYLSDHCNCLYFLLGIW